MLSKSFKWFESNLITILLSLLLALAVWIIATQDEDPIEQTEFEQAIPIQQVGKQEDLLITNSPQSDVTVLLRASRDTLRTLSSEDFTATADLAGLGPGEYDVPVEVSVDAQAVIDSYKPDTIRVNLEEIRERELPVQLVQEGELPNGYRADQAQVDPATATIRGPRSSVELVSEVRAAVSIGGLRETFSGNIELVALSSEGTEVSDVSIRPAQVNVTVPIFQEDDFREVAVRVDGDFQPASGYYVSRFTTDPLLVPIRGDAEDIENIRFVETEPIRLTSLTQDQKITVQLKPPEGATLDEVQTVDVYIFVEAQPGFEVLDAVPVDIIGLGEDLEVSLSPDTVGIFLSGPSPILDAIGTTVEVIVTIDLTDLEEGTYQLQPEIELVSSEISAEELDKIVIESFVPTLIDVEITEPEN